MHIVIDGRELRTSSGRYVERLLHYLQTIDRDSSRHYTVLLKSADMTGWEPHNPRFAKLACDHKEFTFDEQRGLRQQLEGLKPDLVHFTFPQQPVLYKGTAVTTVHDLTTLHFYNPDKPFLIFKAKQAIYKQVIIRAVRKSSHVITPSNYVKQDLIKLSGVGADKITVTYEAADKITDAAQPLHLLENKRFIMYVGRPTPHKNLERLIDTFALLKADHPKLVLVLAGKMDNNYRRIAADVEARGLKDIVFTDFVNEGELHWLYKNCAAYIFPSLSEGFGLPGLEAMQHGAPVASSNATCLPEIYGEAAYYFNPRDTADMVRAIGEVLSDEQLQQTLIKAGERRATEFSWQRMAEQTLAIYKEALKS